MAAGKLCDIGPVGFPCNVHTPRDDALSIETLPCGVATRITRQLLSLHFNLRPNDNCLSLDVFHKLPTPALSLFSRIRFHFPIQPQTCTLSAGDIQKNPSCVVKTGYTDSHIDGSRHPLLKSGLYSCVFTQENEANPWDAAHMPLRNAQRPIIYNTLIPVWATRTGTINPLICQVAALTA